jgi:hypothetical protein
MFTSGHAVNVEIPVSTSSSGNVPPAATAVVPTAKRQKSRRGRRAGMGAPDGQFGGRIQSLRKMEIGTGKDKLRCLFFFLILQKFRMGWRHGSATLVPPQEYGSSSTWHPSRRYKNLRPPKSPLISQNKLGSMLLLREPGETHQPYV